MSFCAKEEKRRLVAAPLIRGALNEDLVGLENHLNYIRGVSRELDEELAYGLSALLNSTFLDRFFRISNGNTQVSATELRAMPLPAERDISQDKPTTRMVDGKPKEISLGADQYINRLIAYIEDSSESSRFREIVGSHLRYIGDRLDALFKAAQKGSHSTVTQEEADRCVVYTYLIVEDILSLR